MAACESLQHIFENSLPEKPTLLDSLSSWNQIKPVNHDDKSSFIEMFGELHFRERSPSSPSLSSSSSSSPSPSPSLSPSPSFPMQTSSSSSSLLDLYPRNNDSPHVNDGKKKNPLDLFSSTPRISYTSSRHSKSDSFSSMNSESLQLCTEGLGFESSDDVEDLKSEMSEEWQTPKDNVRIAQHSSPENLCEFRRPRTHTGAFPPPISSIGKSGKPWVCFKSYRHDGRFVLKEVRMPCQEFLHACREDGRLKLQFVHPNDDILELDEDDYKEDEELEDLEVDEEEENDGVEEDRRKAGT